ncbi:MAG: oligosaccharide flippase family protein [Gemmatimonadetes bacterium]|nr:oligosaccharide flippase family protein [Gemmatimonadota bacterium]
MTADGPPAPRRDAAGSSDVEGVRRVFGNALSLLLAYALPRVFTVGAIVVAARILGAAEFGAYGTAAAYAVILSIVATLGMTPLLVREMAQSPERAPDLMRAAHIVKTASNAVMLIALYGIGRFVLAYPPPVLAAAMLLGFAYAISAYTENGSAWVQSAERMHIWAQASAAYGLVTGALGVVLVIATRSVVWFCAAPIAGQIAAMAWLFRRVPREVRLGSRARPADIARLLRGLAPFTAAFVAVTLHSKADVLLLAQLRTASDVGIYIAGYKFIDVMQALAVVAAAAAYPRLSRMAAAMVRPARWAGTRLIELAMLAAVPIAGALLLARDGAVLLLFGEAYSASSGVVLLLAVAIPALVTNIVGGYILGAAGHMHRVAMLYALSVPLKLGLGGWLIPSRGAPGAALAMLATESLLVIGMLAVLHRHVAGAPSPRIWGAVGAMATVAALLANVPSVAGGWPRAVAFIVVAIGVCAMTGVVPPTERSTLREALTWRRRRAEAR